MTNLLLHYGYAAIFVLTVLEAACIPIPSELTLGLGGALASGALLPGSKVHLNLGVVILIAIVGELIGSMLAYLVGRTGGRALVDRYGKYILVSHKDLDRAEAWFNRRGEPVVLFGRVIPIVRCFISLAAGLAEMNVARFLLFTTIGVGVWVSLLASIGYAVGGSYESVTKGFGYAGYVIAAGAVVVLAAFIVHRYRAVKGHGAESAPVESPPGGSAPAESAVTGGE
ncbi:MAG TPA: DedA family protein [Acidimicrobiales bacterium]|nr:DedA family protein [Acidimicrobiales bacterium]